MEKKNWSEIIPKWAPKCSEVSCEMTKKGLGRDRSISWYYAIIWLATARNSFFGPVEITNGLVKNYFRNISSKNEMVTWFWQKRPFLHRNSLFHGHFFRKHQKLPNNLMTKIGVKKNDTIFDSKTTYFCEKTLKETKLLTRKRFD